MIISDIVKYILFGLAATFMTMVGWKSMAEELTVINIVYNTIGISAGIVISYRMIIDGKI